MSLNLLQENALKLLWMWTPQAPSIWQLEEKMLPIFLLDASVISYAHGSFRFLDKWRHQHASIHTHFVLCHLLWHSDKLLLRKLTYVNVILNKLVRTKIGANTVPILKYIYMRTFLLKIFFVCCLTYYLLLEFLTR